MSGERPPDRRSIWLISRLRAASILLLLALAAACRPGAQPREPDDEPQPIALEAADVHRVAIERVESGPVISGTLTPFREAAVSASVTARVLETFADEGDRVARGARLARLDDVPLREGVLSARSAMRAAEESVDAARRDERRAETLLEAGAIARQELERARSELIRAEAQLADAPACRWPRKTWTIRPYARPSRDTSRPGTCRPAASSSRERRSSRSSI